MLTSEGCAAPEAALGVASRAVRRPGHHRRRRAWSTSPTIVPSPFVFNTVESAAALVLLPDRSILVGDNLLRPFLDRSCVDEVVCPGLVHGQAVGPVHGELSSPPGCPHSFPRAPGASSR